MGRNSVNIDVPGIAAGKSMLDNMKINYAKQNLEFWIMNITDGTYKTYKTQGKSTIPMSYVLLCALACCHASVFAAQALSESDFGISSTWPWTLVVTKFFRDSPKMVQDGPK